MIKWSLQVIYYLGVIASIVTTNHYTIIIPFESYRGLSYLQRLFSKLFYLTNIGALMTLIYFIIRLHQTLNNKQAISTCLQTFYRAVLRANVVVMVAFWALYNIDPLLVHTEESLLLMPKHLDHMLHTVNPLLPWVDILMVTHIKPKSIKGDILISLFSLAVFHSIQLLARYVVFGYYLYGFLEVMSHTQLCYLYLGVFGIQTVTNLLIYRPLVSSRPQ